MTNNYENALVENKNFMLPDTTSFARPSVSIALSHLSNIFCAIIFSPF